MNDRWKVGVTISDNGFKQVSFVNSIATTKVSRKTEIRVTEEMHVATCNYKIKDSKCFKVNLLQTYPNFN